MKLIDHLIQRYVGMKYGGLSDEERGAYISLGTQRVNPISLLPAIESIDDSLQKRMSFRLRRGKTTNGFFGGKRVSLMRGGVGSVSTLHFVRGLIKGGAEIILRVDVCGAFSGDVGDIIVASDCIGDDSYTKRGDKGDIFACDETLLNITNQALEKIDVDDRVRVGRLITVDDYWDQTEEDHLEWERSAIGVDMETSALYYISSKMGVKAISIMCVSDILLCGHDFQRDPLNFPFRKYRKGVDFLIKLTENIVRGL